MVAALEGIRILDLTTVLMGPSATQLLADMGADIIKVESLDGDTTRRTGYSRHSGMTAWFLNLNRGKRSLAIDLKAPQGRDAILRLAESADVLLYNIRPAAMKRLGLSYEAVSAVNPSLLYVGALGFGRDGEYSDLPAYDDLIQAATGMPWLYQFAGGEEPRFVPTPIVDRLMGAHVAMNVLGGLQARVRTGRGQQIDVPMFETMASVMLGDQLSGATFDPPLGPWGYRRMLAPDRKPYPTRDGFVAALPSRDEQWKALFAAVGRSDLYEDDPRFLTGAKRLENVNDLYAIVARLTPERTTAEWLELFKKLDIAAMPVNSIEDVINSRHLADVRFFDVVEHPTEGRIFQMKPAASWSETPLEPGGPAPNLGEHTREILSEAGFTPEEVDALIAARVVKQWRSSSVAQQPPMGDLKSVIRRDAEALQPNSGQANIKPE
jgi:crotonobetainyl-CoA:carnitine CoA-transferase CaiB-like acyl-CoA transferase